MNKEELLNKMKNINKWIEENPEVTEPNMYEMIDCITNIGVLIELGEKDIANVQAEWNKMYAARFDNSKKSDPNFSVNDSTALSAYFHKLIDQCYDGGFKFPEGDDKVAQRGEFLEFIRKIGSISLYVNQQRLQNPNFKFDNQNEYEYLVTMSKKYYEYLPEYSNQVIEDVGKDIIMKDVKQNLLTKMRGINEWIKENPEVTEPNMDEMIDCVTQLGIIARTEGVADMPNNFPEPGSDLTELYSEWNKMYKTRVSLDKVQDENFSVNKNTKLYAYFTDLNKRCCTGEFSYPEDEIERAEFLKCIRKIGSVSLYINQQKLQDPNFVYNNQAEYKGIIDVAEKYSEYLPVHSKEVIDEIGASRMLAQSHPEVPGDDDGEII